MRLHNLIVPCLLLLAGSAVAADKDVEDLLGKMRDAYKSVKTAKITVKGERSAPNSEEKVKTTTEITFKNPTSIHATVKGAPQADGKTLTYRADGKKEIVEGLANGKSESAFEGQRMAPLLGINLEVLNFWDWKRQLSTESGGNMETSKLKIAKEKWNGKEYTVLEEDANVGAGQINVRYFVDPKTYLIWRTVIKTADGDPVSDMQVQKLELNGKVDENLFRMGPIE